MMIFSPNISFWTKKGVSMTFSWRPFSERTRGRRKRNHKFCTIMGNWSREILYTVHLIFWLRPAKKDLNIPQLKSSYELTVLKYILWQNLFRENIFVLFYVQVLIASANGTWMVGMGYRVQQEDLFFSWKRKIIAKHFSILLLYASLSNVSTNSFLTFLYFMFTHQIISIL